MLLVLKIKNKKPRQKPWLIIRRLFFYWSTYWANASASTATDAFICTDNVFVCTCRDSTYWAFCFTCTTADAIRFNFVCHTDTSVKYCSFSAVTAYLYCSRITKKVKSFFTNGNKLHKANSPETSELLLLWSAYLREDADPPSANGLPCGQRSSVHRQQLCPIELSPDRSTD